MSKSTKQHTVYRGTRPVYRMSAPKESSIDIILGLLMVGLVTVLILFL